MNQHLLGILMEDQPFLKSLEDSDELFQLEKESAHWLDLHDRQINPI